jgi:hypothetical protein
MTKEINIDGIKNYLRRTVPELETFLRMDLGTGPSLPSLPSGEREDSKNSATSSSESTNSLDRRGRFPCERKGGIN